MTSVSHKTTVPRRRWPRFSLRTGLVILTAFALWLGWEANHAHRQRRAVAVIETNGGRVWFDFECEENGDLLLPRNQAPRLWLAVTGVTDRGVRHLASLPRLRELELAGTAVSDAGAKTRARLPRLRELHLYETEVSDEGARHFLQTPTLELLRLDRTNISDVLAEELSQASPKLRVVRTSPR